VDIRALRQVFQYEDLRRSLAAAQDIDPREGFVLHRCAALAPGDGAVAVSRTASDSLRQWLHSGTGGAAGKELDVPGEGAGRHDPLRLLVVDAGDGGDGWLHELAVGANRLVAGGYAVVHGVPEGADLDGLHRALVATGAHWRQLGRLGRTVVIEKKP
jgi:hypothetical protein